MRISLSGTRAKTLVLESSNESEESFLLKFAQGFVEEEESATFSILFLVEYKSEENYTLNVEFEAQFLTDDPVDEAFKESHFPKVNAPAIAYPYLRSFISTITMNAGYESVILPTVNFSALEKERQEAEKQMLEESQSAEPQGNEA